MPRDFVLALDEIWVKDADGKGRTVAVQATTPQELEQIVLAASASSGAETQAVMYEDGAERNDFTRRLVTPFVTVKLADQTDAASVAGLAQASSFDLPDYAPGYAVLRTGGGLAALRAVDLLSGAAGVELVEPQLARLHTKKAMPNDPLINQQWHHKFNSQAGAVAGTDLNIETAWAYPTGGAGRRGRGIRIGIVDDGLQTAHPDLSANVDTANDKDWNGNDADPNPGSGDDHGTACAGDAAARGNNSLGVSGSAPEATLVGMRLISAAVTDGQEAEAISYLPELIQIQSNSWGPSDTGSLLEGPGPLATAAFKTAAETGRGGKGTIFLWAGGNGLGANDNSNYDGYANSIYTIAVGAFDSQARQAYYSEPGANLVIVSPSNGNLPALGKTTTDRTGTNLGYNTAASPTGDYTDDFGGTSSATPTAAGVVALMLEANPNLGWRDVQEILMRSARKVSPTDTDWKAVVAPANINHNHKFGAGLIDATAAVNLATGWTNLSAQLKRTVAQTGLSVAIPNQNTTGITRDFVVGAADNLRVEHVTVAVNITHTSRGNLKVTLTSPSGTVSRLAEVHSDSGDNYPATDPEKNYPNWKFMTVRNWGENAAGTWRLKITDESASGNTTGGTLTAVTMEVFGSSTVPVNPPPAVSLTSPAGDLVVSPGAAVSLAAAASDFDATGAAGTVAQVEFLANGSVINTDTLAPYSFSWSPTVGTYQVTARATDSEGAAATSGSLRVEVRNQLPTITSAQTSPAGSAHSDQAITLTGVVSNDPEGSAVTLAYQWQSTLNGTTWTNASGQTSATLPASPSNAGLLWRCLITPNDGAQNGEVFTGPTVSVSNRPAAAATLGAGYSHQPGLYVPSVTASFTRPVIINEFSQGPSGGTAEWVELLTLEDTSLAFYDISDASDNYLLFLDDPVWDNIPAGTTIVIYNGATTKDPLLPADDLNPNDDGRMVVSSQNAAYFDDATAWPGLGNSGDSLFINDADSLTVAELSYGNSTLAAPNVGTVTGGRAAYYAGDTEEGITSGVNWRTTTSATARSLRATKALGDLFFSEYVEGTGNNKAVEVYNPSGSAVNLATAGYLVQMYFNGVTNVGTSVALTGTVAAGGVHVLAFSGSTNTLLALANQTNGSSFFNGDDAVVLRKGGTNGAVVDAIGQIGFDPGTAWSTNGVSTLDRTLRRKSAVVQGDTNATNAFNPSVEWDNFAADTFGGLGSHSTSSGPALGLGANPLSFAENAGTNASTGTVVIPATVASNVVVTLSSGNTNAATVPATATINAGSTNVTFPIAAIDNALSDGSKLVTISATAAGYAAGSVQVTVTDNETPIEGVTPGAGNSAANTQFIAGLRAGIFGQAPLYRTGTGHQMPPGLSLDPATGLLSGTPTQVGTYTIVLERYNSLGDVATQTYQLVISAAGTSYETWISGYPGLSDATRGGDPEKDGTSNLLEYFMSLDPSVSDRGLTFDFEGGVLTLDYRRSKTATGVAGVVKWHPNLTNAVGWSTNGVTDVLLSDHGTYEMRRATVPVPSEDGQRFLRLEIEAP
jgi:subtilisin-like proprotein convertase family protein